MTDAQIIVLATPVFFALIGLEYWIGVRRGRDTYRLNDAVSSIALGMLSQVVGVLTKLFTLGIYTWVFERAALMRLDAGAWWVWLTGLLLYDFLYYWHHRLGHTTALLWAAHAVHHQSEDYNLSTALRQTGSGWLVGWIFYLPMAILGFPPLVFAVVALVDLLYQFWVHTQQVGRLGWFDRWFCSPSNHRVHHAVNDPYLDRNYGGILVIWDRMFGSFQEELEREPCVYGTRDALASWDPWTANVQVYAKLLRKARRTPRWRDKLRLWWEPAHWEPGVGARIAPGYDPRARPLFDPPVPSSHRIAAAALFVALLGGVALFLWNAHRLGPMAQLGVLAGLLAGQALTARLLTPRPSSSTRGHP
ncbi:MAG: sterol desaturase family protein [Mitsuaria chitosanitabida]|uniref:sterol desaturase family protein n=1 Tax=Roseateles chitosanitabidus TaxID=65048 RepID=UPI001B0BE748|nr:sterol desaturase family protein [Roseateles chitosanitabidus]MBO9686800.1 sterol desaturase family protein [Roseateles chitosanitabidus]